MGLAMFGLILDRVLAITHDAYTAALRLHDDANADASASAVVYIADALTEDARILLPAIKVWCDWLLANTAVWNPPPPLIAFAIGHPVVADPWTLLARLVTLFERIKPAKRYIHIQAPDAGAAAELVRLPEDIALLGFAPLDQHLDLEPVYCDRTDDLDLVHTVYRIKRIVFLCTKCFTRCEPPVLWRRDAAAGDPTTAEYRSVVGALAGAGESALRQHANSSAELGMDDLLLLESFSDDEADALAMVAEQRSATAERDVMATGKLEYDSVRS